MTTTAINQVVLEIRCVEERLRQATFYINKPDGQMWAFTPNPGHPDLPLLPLKEFKVFSDAAVGHSITFKDYRKQWWTGTIVQITREVCAPWMRGRGYDTSCNVLLANLGQWRVAP